MSADPIIYRLLRAGTFDALPRVVPLARGELPWALRARMRRAARRAELPEQEPYFASEFRLMRTDKPSARATEHARR